MEQQAGDGAETSSDQSMKFAGWQLLFRHFCCLLAFLLQTLLAAHAQTRSVPIPLEMDEMLSAGRKIYDKQSTPTQMSGLPTMVKLAMYIEGIGSFRTHTMDFQLDVYLQQFWKDPRLAHNESSRILIRDRAILNRIWHPDVYFANARIAQFHEVTQPNFLVWIDPDGSILYDTRVSMIVICAMNLKNFPLDSQWCHLRILSYAYDIHHLQIEWIEKEPITKNENITMSDMDIVKLVPGTCDGIYNTGTWSCVTAEFFVSRELTHHILQTYVPTTLIVVISWFSFWLDVEAVPARVSLAITTLLTLSTQANSVKNSLPEVSYMKSLDLFLAVSVLFVFGVLIEFTIVNYTQRNATMAAAGLIDEKESTPRCSCTDMLCKTLSRLFRRNQKGLNLTEEKSWSLPVENSHRAKLSPIRLSLLRRLSHRNWAGSSKSPEKWTAAADCNSVIDVEAGPDGNNNNSSSYIYSSSIGIGNHQPTTGNFYARGENNNNNNNNGNNNCLLNRKASAKKLLAMEKASSVPRIPQLQHVSSVGSAGGGARNRVGAAPIIVYEEEEGDCGPAVGGADRRRSRQQQQPQQSVDRREAARLAYWSRPELSCEGLAQRAKGGAGQQQMQQQQPPMIVEPNNEPSRPPLAQQEGSSTSSTPPSKRLSTCFMSSSQDHLNMSNNRKEEMLAAANALLGPGGAASSEPRPVSRRASAMASLLDPINIGSGQRRDSLISTAGNMGSQSGAQQSMTPQAKWRHAVRKLQMNKREAGRMQAKKIDAMSRWAFPISYLSFQAAYWYYYLRVAA